MKLTAAFAVAIVVIIATYDVWTLAFRGYDTTLSWSLYMWSHDWPIIPFVFGVFAGHLFFPNRASTMPLAEFYNPKGKI